MKKEKGVEAEERDTAIQRHKGGSLPQAADWRGGGREADAGSSLVPGGDRPSCALAEADSWPY